MCSAARPDDYRPGKTARPPQTFAAKDAVIPLRDDIPARRTPVVNYAILALTSLAFLSQLMTPEDGPSLVERFGMIPQRVSEPAEPVAIPDVTLMQTGEGVREVVRYREAAEAAVPPWATLVTCVFLHGGWMHFLGNMWFLWIFGDNVEDRFGRLGYLVLYLGCGALASLSHYVTDPMSPVPTIGASGAIAGVMGSYLVSYPHSRVLSLIPLGFIFTTFVVPAPLFLGVWFLIQLYNGSQAVGVETAGVAWWAHIGGFAVGAALTVLGGRTGLIRDTTSRRRLTHGGQRLF